MRQVYISGTIPVITVLVTGECSTIFLQLDSPKQMTLHLKAFIPMQQTLDRACMTSNLSLFHHLNSKKYKKKSM
jgi:hypothetical protein